jgi:hypothetical protein
MQEKLISELQDSKYHLVTDSQDVEGVLESIGQEGFDGDGLLVEVLDGEYGEVWGFHGCVPRLNKTAVLLSN